MSQVIQRTFSPPPSPVSHTSSSLSQTQLNNSIDYDGNNYNNISNQKTLNNNRNNNNSNNSINTNTNNSSYNRGVVRINSPGIG